MELAHEKREQAAELQAVLGSKAFSKSANLGKLLSYLCSHYLDGNGSSPNEYTIGTEALGRPSNFDPATNSIVRVEVHRLRQKLRTYYAEEGSADPIRIVLESGSYVPQFVRREELDSQRPTLASGEPLADPPVEGQEATNVPALEAGGKVQAITTRKAYTLAAAGVFVLLLLLLSAIFIRDRWRSNNADSVPVQPPSRAQLPILPVSDSVRILCGYTRDRYVDREGNVWSGDRYFSGGESRDDSFPYLQGTLDPTIFRTKRTGDFSYNIPLKSGSYELHLYFAETEIGPGTELGRGEASRIFQIVVNGRTLLKNLDVFGAIGGNNRVYVRVFKNVSPSPDGQVHLEFHGRQDRPFVNAIELTPQLGARTNPIRIVAQENSYTDSSGHIWEPDRYASGGLLATHPSLVLQAADRHLYDGERFGNFSYSIPVAPGKYGLTLHFVETYFGTGQEKKDDASETHRLFDVYINGEGRLRSFDISKEAGGPGHPITKTFHNLEPNASGLIILNFVPVANYACVSAIELEQEGD